MNKYKKDNKLINRMRTNKIRDAMPILIMAIVFLLSFTSASLGTFKQNECMSVRVLANCSSINLTEISDGQVTYVINSVMQNMGGQTFNYTFCNTTNSGIYSYSWNNPCVDCATNDCGNSFRVTATGEDYDQSQFGIIIAEGILIALFIGLGFSFSKERWKLRGFFFVLSLFIAVLMINSIRVLAGASDILTSMGNTMLIVGIIAVSFMAVYLLIIYTIEIFQIIKNKKEMRWQVSDQFN